MDDLISRQALRSEMYHEAFEKDTEDQRWDSGCWIRYRMFERIIDSIPSAQPEQPGIIRCKDCVSYGEMLTGRDTRMICHKFALNFPRDFYCADAERRTDG